jgi:hypothetical protein
MLSQIGIKTMSEISAEYVMRLEASLAGTKQCSRCKQVVSLNAFSKNSRMVDGLAKSCRSCKQAEQLKHKYNITIQDKQALYARQNGKCKLCQKPIAFDGKGTHIDHCHETGRVRGILCQDCNTSLGKLGDSATTLYRAYLYVSGQLLD